MLSEKQKLETLKTIAETLNQSLNKQEMLQTVLQQFIHITHFEAGWIFFEKESVELVANVGLPEALAVNNKQAMCGEDCYCVSRYKSQRLTKATSIIECKRLETAIKDGKYNTNGYTHHATVPLKTPEKQYGLLNVATPNRTEYIEEELSLLEAVALQIGTALRRIEQYEKEEIRANYFEQLNHFVQQLRIVRNGHHFVSIAEKELSKMFHVESIHIKITPIKDEESDTTLIIPFQKINGALLARQDVGFSTIEKEMLRLAVHHFELAYRDIQLQEKEKDMARIQERTKLAQDLHDSVNQLLFSIVLTSKAAKQVIQRPEIDDIYELSSQALSEMRALIAGQKPQGLEKGLLTSLIEYAEKLKLSPRFQAAGTLSIPYAIEETLYRIGQEAVHNIKKHANTDCVEFTLHRSQKGFTMVIQDDGEGFELDRVKTIPSYGLKGMEERAAIYNGTVTVKSSRGNGTIVEVFIPNREETNNESFNC
ncbi:GAF domain-containing sensor histidine kinase [Salirhabdus salicampi]|uniref:GAF domain-containing sensor histidine kinase n=1 Tax=Salirhabdus salicampi TaxID=476102 RepID=UPI0020C33E10|nr:GAF domain-containing sensor histidine kinase [Salirhabdus salicampi]MCP8615325.1 GAF domain-containing sensor histidine kinase [Salirhabdus salicampi]